jgi:hypothetical protein
MVTFDASLMMLGIGLFYLAYECLSVAFVCDRLFCVKIRGQCYKTFSVCKLQIFVLSWSVCYIRMEKLTKDKYSSLLRKYIFYGQKSFITLGPVDCVAYWNR